VKSLVRAGARAVRAAFGGALLLWPLLWTLAAAADGPKQQVCDTTQYPLSSPTSRFEDHGDGTVTDKQSNLMWMRCAAGQRWSAGSCLGEPSALTWNAAQGVAQSINKSGNFFYNDWRIPQIPELAGIAERQCRDPRINLSVFPNTPADDFWTASTRQTTGTAAFAFVLSFGPSGVRYESKEEKHHVRLVRTAP
jgi:hypothetical protein